MRYFLVLFMFGAIWISSANADEVTTINWDVIGIQDAQLDIESGGGIDEIILDTRWSNFGAANGVARLDTGFTITATGTCFFGSNGIFCDLNVRGSSLVMVLDSETGSGTISVRNAQGISVADGAVVLKTIN